MKTLRVECLQCKAEARLSQCLEIIPKGDFDLPPGMRFVQTIRYDEDLGITLKTVCKKCIGKCPSCGVTPCSSCGIVMLG